MLVKTAKLERAIYLVTMLQILLILRAYKGAVLRDNTVTSHNYSKKLNYSYTRIETAQHTQIII